MGRYDYAVRKMAGGTVHGTARVATPRGRHQLHVVPLAPVPVVTCGMTADIDTANTYFLLGPVRWGTFTSLGEGCVISHGEDLDGTFGPTPPHVFFDFDPGHITGTITVQTAAVDGGADTDEVTARFYEAISADPVATYVVTVPTGTLATVDVDLDLTVTTRLTVEMTSSTFAFTTYAAGAIDLVYS